MFYIYFHFYSENHFFSKVTNYFIKNSKTTINSIYFEYFRNFSKVPVRRENYRSDVSENKSIERLLSTQNHRQQSNSSNDNKQQSISKPNKKRQQWWFTHLRLSYFLVSK
jgi:hypothetical protein